MEYRAVGKRCAVHLASLDLPISDVQILAVLLRKGFVVVHVDIIEQARKCIGSAIYRRGARLSEAPRVFDCSSFIKWLYALRGVWLPRRSIQQREFGEPVPLHELMAGDVVFVSGFIDYYQYDPQDGVGHVGIVTGDGTVVHAANKKMNIVETPVEEFVGTSFRGARRYIPKDKEVLTFESPENREVEISDDMRWIVLQSLTSK